MSFEALCDRLPVLSEGPPPDAWPRVGRGGVSFSDDLARADGGRLGVRVRITDREDGGYVIDLRDSDPPEGARFGLDPSRARTACLLALGHALGRTPTRGWATRLELLTDPQTWIGTDDPSPDPAAIAFGMARTADALLGALANAWPGRVGAGSCSLGAVVELRTDERVVLTEVLPGGEGGHPDRAGADAWPGLIVPSSWGEPPIVDGATLEGTIREDSRGIGKHPGGHGITRTYRIHRPMRACVAFDRARNPPHGIDRAGPPAGSEVWHHPADDGRAQPVRPWTPMALRAGARLVVQTCGGAGWGFPGYGDIEWDPGEWFGRKATTSS